MNLQIENFNTNLYQVINEANLPVGVIKLVLENVYNQISQLYIEQLKTEMMEQEEKGEENESTINNNNNNT